MHRPSLGKNTNSRRAHLSSARTNARYFHLRLIYWTAKFTHRFRLLGQFTASASSIVIALVSAGLTPNIRTISWLRPNERRAAAVSAVAGRRRKLDPSMQVIIASIGVSGEDSLCETRVRATTAIGAFLLSMSYWRFSECPIELGQCARKTTLTSTRNPNETLLTQNAVTPPSMLPDSKPRITAQEAAVLRRHGSVRSCGAAPGGFADGWDSTCRSPLPWKTIRA